mmetsp:Transcript_87029/g.186501  ORF Transcript_87029/g.186501 Transcript_87029/m.186501 type:complete len:272 (-) Transcript_87029:746-1561(-)
MGPPTSSRSRSSDGSQGAAAHRQWFTLGAVEPPRGRRQRHRHQHHHNTRPYCHQHHHNHELLLGLSRARILRILELPVAHRREEGAMRYHRGRRPVLECHRPQDVAPRVEPAHVLLSLRGLAWLRGLDLGPEAGLPMVHGCVLAQSTWRGRAAASVERPHCCVWAPIKEGQEARHGATPTRGPGQMGWPHAETCGAVGRFQEELRRKGPAVLRQVPWGGPHGGPRPDLDDQHWGQRSRKPIWAGGAAWGRRGDSPLAGQSLLWGPMQGGRL